VEVTVETARRAQATVLHFTIGLFSAIGARRQIRFFIAARTPRSRVLTPGDTEIVIAGGVVGG
jgi:hypothetical protein